MSDLFRIAWRSKLTGWTGAGVPCMTKADAEAERDRLNKQWPMLDHWVEQSDTTTTGDRP